jgi:signal transduction histidine kinase
MKQEVRLRMLSVVVIIYIMAAFVWWSVLLFRKNEEVYRTRYALYAEKQVSAGMIKSSEAFWDSQQHQQMRRQYEKQKRMIVGEGIVFVISLILGIGFINRGYLKEVAATRQRRNFLLSITHELKSPIAGIQLTIETLLKRDLSKEQTQRLLGNAAKETNRLKNLVNDLLLSAKLETAYQLQLSDIHLPELLQGIVEEMQEKHPGAVFSLEAAEDFPIFQGDLSGLSSVCTNLLENAVKYSPTPAQVSIRLSQQGSIVRLEVMDNGIGIPERERKKIFSKFYRIGNEDTRNTKGTGLGLYIVEQIVHAHRGTISVHENKPAGTIFVIEFPTNHSTA